VSLFGLPLRVSPGGRVPFLSTNVMNCNRTAAHVVLHQFTTLSHRLEVVQDLAVVVSMMLEYRYNR
jgi:hypothetical protein